MHCAISYLFVPFSLCLLLRSPSLSLFLSPPRCAGGWASMMNRATVSAVSNGDVMQEDGRSAHTRLVNHDLQ